LKTFPSKGKTAQRKANCNSFLGLGALGESRKKIEKGKGQRGAVMGGVLLSWLIYNKKERLGSVG